MKLGKKVGVPLEGDGRAICRLAQEHILARPKFPSRASDTFIVLARGVDIIARDYVKVTRSVTRRREPARARSDKARVYRIAMQEP